MNLDFQWFLSIPGMLISGGVLLLVIALIIFLATSKKKDKPAKPSKNKKIDAAVPSDMVSAQQPVADVPVEPLNEVMTPGGVQAAPQSMGDLPPIIGQNPAPVVDANPTPIPDTTKPQMQPTATEPIAGVVPNMNTVANDPIAPTVNLQSDPVPPVEPAVQPQPVAPATPQPVVQAPVPEPTPAPVTVPTPEPVAPVSTPVVETPQVPTPQVEVPTPVESNNGNSNVSIYGGASPVVPDLNLQQDKPHQIYGGADPLENTQPLNVAAMNPNPTPVIPPQPVPIPPVQTPNPGVSQPPVSTPQPVGAPNPVPTPQPVQGGIPMQNVEATAPSTNVEVLNI